MAYHENSRPSSAAATTTSSSSITKEPIRWAGRLVGRLLPPDLDAAYEEQSKPKPPLRIEPGTLLVAPGPMGRNLRECHRQQQDREQQQKQPPSDTRGLVAFDEGSGAPRQAVFDAYLYLARIKTAGNAAGGSPGEDVIKIHLNRDSKEKASRTWQRLKLTMEKRLTNSAVDSKGGKGKEKKKSKVPPEPEVVQTSAWCRSMVTNPDSDGDELLTGYELWNDASSLSLRDLLRQTALGGKDVALSVPLRGVEAPILLQIEACPPTITSVRTFGTFQAKVFTRVPLVVEVELLYANKSKISWFADERKVCDDSPSYTPTEEDVGKSMSVLIVPLRSDHGGKGCEEAYRFVQVVEKLPFMPILSPLRDEWTIQRGHMASSHLRVATYNILANQNASRDLEETEQKMYAQCSAEHLVKWRRMPMVVAELLAYKPDVICLQEVDESVYDGILRPVLEAEGYQGFFSIKDRSSQQEGCAMFWSLDAFDRADAGDMRTYNFSDMLQRFCSGEEESDWESFSDVATLLVQHEHLRDIIYEQLGHVLQIAILTRKHQKERIVVGNTHLFYHPMASHVRALQILTACRQLDIEHKSHSCPLLFCGDFNSHPKSGAMKLLFDRHLSAGHERTWKNLQKFQWEEGENEGKEPSSIKPIDLTFPSSFPPLRSGYPELPQFTHLIDAFISTLDYIMVSDAIVPARWAPMPSIADVKRYVAMPNEFMPSDHVSLVCDLKWNEAMSTRQEGR